MQLDDQRAVQRGAEQADELAQHVSTALVGGDLRTVGQRGLCQRRAAAVNVATQACHGQFGAQCTPVLVFEQVAKCIVIDDVAQVVTIALAQVQVTNALDKRCGVQLQGAEVCGEQPDGGMGFGILQGGFEHRHAPGWRCAGEHNVCLEQRCHWGVREPLCQCLRQQRQAEGIHGLQRCHGLFQALCLALAVADQQGQFGAPGGAGLA
ncbi:hypothetical protein D3C76_838590 [compost metagenome]